MRHLFKHKQGLFFRSSKQVLNTYVRYDYASKQVLNTYVRYDYASKQVLNTYGAARSAHHDCAFQFCALCIALPTHTHTDRQKTPIVFSINGSVLLQEQSIGRDKQYRKDNLS